MTMEVLIGSAKTPQEARELLERAARVGWEVVSFWPEGCCVKRGYGFLLRRGRNPGRASTIDKIYRDDLEANRE